MNSLHLAHAPFYYRFRRQHEQLRQVIIRVLRPVTVKRGSSPGNEENESKDKPVTDEAADANAIEVIQLMGNKLHSVLCSPH